MSQNQDKPETTIHENADLENAEFPADEPGLTTAFEKDGATEFTADGPTGPHIESQDEFWEGVKNADQTPRDVASTVPTDVAEPETTPEAARDDKV